MNLARKFRAYIAELRRPSSFTGYDAAANQLGHTFYGLLAATAGLWAGYPFVVVCAYVAAYWGLWEVPVQGGGKANAIDAAFVAFGGLSVALLSLFLPPLGAVFWGGIACLIASNLYGIATQET